jgi:hypothetical protein
MRIAQGAKEARTDFLFLWKRFIRTLWIHQIADKIDVIVGHGIPHHCHDQNREEKALLLVALTSL